jgi:hypothetical protein
MTTEFLSASPYVSRILQSYVDQDSNELQRTIAEAVEAGLPVTFLMTALAGALSNALTELGFHLDQDLQFIPEFVNDYVTGANNDE